MEFDDLFRYERYIHSTTVVHINDGYDVLIARPSKWGNPFSTKLKSSAKYFVKTKKDAIEKYEFYLENENKQLLDDLIELKNKRLGCWCKKNGKGKCHGDVLVKLIKKYRI